MTDFYEIHVHDFLSRNMDQVREYLTGDDHSQSKVALFDGEKFQRALEMPSGNYRVCTGNGEIASLAIKGEPHGSIGGEKRSYHLA